MRRKPPLFLLCSLVSLNLTALAQPEAARDGTSDRADDRAAIRAHIESIFDAFVAKDAAKLRATHSDDWRGFLEGSRVPIRGLEEYMRAVGGGLKDPTAGMSSWKITDFDTQFHGPDQAVVSFNADIEMRRGGSSTLRILDVYERRAGAWIQVASHTVTHPAALQRQIAAQIAAQTAAQNADGVPALIAQLRANSLALALNDGVLSGTGRDFLLREAERASFFLIGEEHGFAENPLIAKALLQELSAYRHFAAEIGPITAARLEAEAHRHSVSEVLAGFNRRYPFSLPFFNWLEEGSLLATALDPKRTAGARLWGLDQEFFFSPVYHFVRLQELAPDARARAAAQEFVEGTRGELDRAAQSHDPGGAFVATAKPADFDRLDTAFRSASPEARRILRALRESAAIYQKNLRGEVYANNAERAQLLKRNFMAALQAARATDPAPKMFFKFGAGHVMRGRSYTNVFDLGNFVAEVAASQGRSSFHVLVMATGGTYNKYLPFVGNEADKRKELVPASTYFYADVQPFVAAADPPGLRVIDLRPLRPLLGTRALPNLPRGVSELITGFDAVVLVTEAHPATL